MKVLWLCNIALPMIARQLGLPVSHKEGWLSGMAEALLAGNGEVKLYVAFPVSPGSGQEVWERVVRAEGSEAFLICYGFPENADQAEKYSRNLEPELKKIVDRVEPDVIHCFGTEYPHTLAMCRVAPEKDRLLLGLQGLCTCCAEAYMANLPERTAGSATFRDILKRDSLRRQQRKFFLRGVREREAAALAGNVTGRTLWDESQTRKWNPRARYFGMNETLRTVFYGPRWREENCVPHSIFMSQGDYPLKGLHYMLLAMPAVLERYPDARLYVAGASLVEWRTLKQKLKLSGYGKYLRELLGEYGLWDKVTFLGRLDQEQMLARYLKSSLYVCASSLENSPNSLGEAMLLGMPCVSADVGGIPSMFRDGIDGITYKGFRQEGEEGLRETAGNLAEAILRMWDNPEKQREYCENAAAHGRDTHDREKNYRRLLEIYREMGERKREKAVRVVFVSNYINHHQIPFCNAMDKLLEGGFTFIQTEPMEEERVRMGWHAARRPSYVHCYYEEEDYCRGLIAGCDILLFGGTDDESYAVQRLKLGRPVIRVSERLYKTGQWKAVSPRGLIRKYQDHTRYRRGPVYLLCAGAYVASDFRIIGAYPGKKYCWGYFPETRRYDAEALLAGKGWGEDRRPCLLWAARMIDWKHPELALETAAYLKERKLSFHMNIIGDGELRPRMEETAKRLGLEDWVTFLGYREPEEVREYMEKADIFLFTSDRQEGWGAVANEAMNSGCALVANEMIGAVPYLVNSGENGLVYQDGRPEQLFSLTERLVKDKILCRNLGKNAYETITQCWNAENAAENLMKLIRCILNGTAGREKLPSGRESAVPCGPAPMIGEPGMSAKRIFGKRR